MVINIFTNTNIVINDKLHEKLRTSAFAKSIILMGNLNSHHPIWNGTDTNKGGRTIAYFILDIDIAIMNDGSEHSFTKLQ